MSFGIRLRNIRKDSRISQTQLGQIIGVSSASISQYELDKRFPDKLTLIKICKYFNISADYLLELSSNKNPVQEKNGLVVNCSNITKSQREAIFLLLHAFSAKGAQNE